MTQEPVDYEALQVLGIFGLCLVDWVLVTILYKRLTGADLAKDFNAAIRGPFLLMNFAFWGRHPLLLLAIVVSTFGLLLGVSSLGLLEGWDWAAEAATVATA